MTANKALVAVAGPELYDAADRSHVDLLFEAAVGGGIPIIRPLRESLAGDGWFTCMGIVNGTTNFILTRMAEEGTDFAAALAEAQRLGSPSATRPPTSRGIDAAAKAAILATIAFGAWSSSATCTARASPTITADDIAVTPRLGYVIKLLAVAEELDGRRRSARRGAGPPGDGAAEHPLASVRDSFNAVFIEGEAVGELMFYGRGAGGGPTATAVLGDLIDAAQNLRRGTHAASAASCPPTSGPIDELESRTT